MRRNTSLTAAGHTPVFLPNEINWAAVKAVRCSDSRCQLMIVCLYQLGEANLLAQFAGPSRPGICLFLSCRPRISLLLSCRPRICLFLSCRIRICFFLLSSRPTICLFVSCRPKICLFLSSRPRVCLFLSSRPRICLFLSCMPLINVPCLEAIMSAIHNGKPACWNFNSTLYSRNKYPPAYLCSSCRGSRQETLCPACPL